MHNDIYGRQILTEDDLCEAYLRDQSISIQNAIVNKAIKFDPRLELENIPKLLQVGDITQSKEDFDSASQSNWYMPSEYKEMDIASWILAQCQTDTELQRVGQELLLFQERNLFPLLCYCKYLVDTMRKHNIVWGVGRGSSVSSYVLFLIGIHKIDSLFYDLSIDEFLK
jgi:DNA polymerase III alpha subunit